MYVSRIENNLEALFIESFSKLSGELIKKKVRDIAMGSRQRYQADKVNEMLLKKFDIVKPGEFHSSARVN